MSASETATTTTSLWHRDFQLISLASWIAFLGDQFSLVALPWLVLGLSDDATALAVVVTLQGVPRALLLLFGGGVVDRYSAKRVLWLSKLASALLLLILLLALGNDRLTLAGVYGFAFLHGIASAFTLPATAAVLPQVAVAERLHQANVVRLALEKVSVIVGPVIAGWLVATYADQLDWVRVGDGIFYVLSVNLTTYLLAVLAILATGFHSPAYRDKNLWQGLAEGWRYFIGANAIRNIILYVAAVNVFVAGPLHVGLPLLVKLQLHGGADAYGNLLALLSIGMIAGMLMSNVIKLPTALGLNILLGDIACGLLMVLISLQQQMLFVYLLMAVIGVVIGFLQVSMLSWLQSQIPLQFQGRIMAIVQFAVLGIAPLSASLAGTLLQNISVNQLFTVSGIGLAILAMIAMVASDIVRIRYLPQTAAAEPIS